MSINDACNFVQESINSFSHSDIQRLVSMQDDENEELNDDKWPEDNGVSDYKSGDLAQSGKIHVAKSLGKSPRCLREENCSRLR